MDAFENVMATILENNGYWLQQSVKVNLIKEDKREINKPSSPRWELDLVAYNPKVNELLVVECKSYLDSQGVKLAEIEMEDTSEGRYKLFTDKKLRGVVFNRLLTDFVERGFCLKNTRIILALAVGKIYQKEKSLPELEKLFNKNSWKLLDPNYIKSELRALASRGYENDTATIVSKILMRD